MTALAAERVTKRFPNTQKLNDFVGTSAAGLPIAASASKIWAGAMVGMGSTGYVVRASANPALKIIGVASVTRDNSSGAAGDLSMPVRAGCWQYGNNGTSCATKDIGANCYVVDDQTVDLSSNGGLRPVAGVIRSVDSDGVWVDFSATVQPSATPVQSGGNIRQVRGVCVSAITLTNFTMASADLTFVEGDRILLIAQAAPAANGIYIVGADGSGSGGAGKAALTRPPDFASGQVLEGMLILVAEGTSFSSTIWQMSTADTSIVVDTDTINFTQKFTTRQAGTFHTARYVCTSNVADLTAFTVLQDGVTGVATDRVLLVNQTTASQNGLWTLGTVGSGTAPLTRPVDYPPAGTMPHSMKFLVSEGTVGALSEWVVTSTGSVVVDTTNVTLACPQGNWYSMAGITTLGTQANPSSKYVAAVQLKAKTSGLFRVDVDIAFNGGTTADVVTAALITDTAAAGLLASANKVAHGVKGVGTLVGTNSGDGETIDTNDGATLTFNGAAWNTAPIIQKSETFATLTGLLTAQASGHLKFSFHGIVHNAIGGTTKTPFTIGNTVGFGVKFSATNTLTFASVNISVQELPSG